MTKKAATGIGEILWDVFPHNIYKPGGAPSNFAYHMEQLGFEGNVVSAVGNDKAGKELREYIQSKGIKTYIQVNDFPTGEVRIELDKEGIPQYDIKENVAWDNINFTSDLEQLAEKSVAVCFGSLAQRSPVSAATIKQFLKKVSYPDAYKIFDINIRKAYFTKEIILDSLEICNILKINEDEFPILCKILELSPKDKTEENCQKIIANFDLHILILTCGSEGSYVFSPETSSFYPTPKVQVIDTVGAGDSFTAAFIASLYKHKDIKKAHEFAVKYSAHICTQNGAMPLLPYELTNQL